MSLTASSLDSTLAPSGPGKVLVPWSVQGGFHRPVIVRAAGSYFYDRDGKSYLDLTSGFVSVSLGHGHPKVVAAIKEQAERLCWVSPGYFNDVRAEYAELLSTISPWPEGARVHYASGGGEANDDVIKVARLVTGRPKVMAAYRSYHGGTIASSSLTGIDRWRDPFPGMPGVVRFFAPYPYRSPFHATTPAEETARALDHVERILLHEGAGNVGAILIEPVTGSSNVVSYPAGYLAGLRAICDRHGILLVYDEVMTGFGRVGESFAAVRLGVAPHMLTFAKGVNSGYLPLGGVLITESIAERFDRELFDVGHTNSGQVLAVAAGLAATRVYLEEGLFERAREIERWIGDGLAGLARRHAIVGDVRGMGALFGIELVKSRETKEPLVPWHDPQGPGLMKPFYQELLARGVHGYGRYNIVMVAPPLTISEEEWKIGLDAIDQALTKLEASL